VDCELRSRGSSPERCTCPQSARRCPVSVLQQAQISNAHSLIPATESGNVFIGVGDARERRDCGRHGGKRARARSRLHSGPRLLSSSAFCASGVNHAHDRVLYLQSVIIFAKYLAPALITTGGRFPTPRSLPPRMLRLKWSSIELNFKGWSCTSQTWRSVRHLKTLT